jgi:hypothetical protein
MLTRTAGLIASAIAGATSIVYIIIILVQGEADVGRVMLVLAMILGAATAAAVGGATANVTMKNVLLGGASGGLLSPRLSRPFLPRARAPRCRCRVDDRLDSGHGWRR